LPTLFPGTIIHSHNFRDGKDYKNLRVLCVGGSYSAEDIALQCWKFGAELAHITHRNPKALGYQDLPENVLERPILTQIDGSKVRQKFWTEF